MKTNAQTADQAPIAVLLGASNLRRGLVPAVEEVRHRLGPRVDIFAALGNGRSYGLRSTFIARALPGILDSNLWSAIETTSSKREVRVLMTDVGNDLAYGASPTAVTDWLSACLDRLPAHARVSLTLLPMPALRQLSKHRFELFRRLFFPGRTIDLDQLLGDAEQLCEHLTALSQDQRLKLIEPANAWYGFDPIHIRRQAHTHAWSTMMSSWDLGGEPKPGTRLRTSERLRLLCARPHQVELLGLELGAPQPALRCNDGTVISLF